MPEAEQVMPESKKGHRDVVVPEEMSADEEEAGEGEYVDDVLEMELAVVDVGMPLR